jgi:hypothetical protein
MTRVRVDPCRGDRQITTTTPPFPVAPDTLQIAAAPPTPLLASAPSGLPPCTAGGGQFLAAQSVALSSDIWQSSAGRRLIRAREAT